MLPGARGSGGHLVGAHGKNYKVVIFIRALIVVAPTLCMISSSTAQKLATGGCLFPCFPEEEEEEEEVSFIIRRVHLSSPTGR